MDNKYGICEWCLPVSGVTAIVLAGEMGYDGVQLSDCGGRKAGFPLNEKRLQELYREAADRSGIRLHSINSGSLLAEGSMNYAKGTIQYDYADLALKKSFEVCRDLDLHSIVLTFDNDNEEGFENSMVHLKNSEKIASEYGITIAVETGQTIEKIKRMMDGLRPETKICMDLLNPERFGTGNPQEQIRFFGKDRIDHFHFKDSTRNLFAKGQRGCVPLGSGDCSLKESVELIKELEIEGWMITENYYNQPPITESDLGFIRLASDDLKAMQKFFLD